MKYGYEEFSLLDVIRRIRSGSIALPEFQRPFVWSPSDVIDLLDSVANGWPIGTFLMLQGPQPFEVRAIHGGPPVNKDEIEHYLLDGQQRATALYQVITQDANVIYYIDLNEGSSDDPPDFQWTKSADVLQEREWAHPVGALMDESYAEDVLARASGTQRIRMRATLRARLGALIDPNYKVPAIVLAQGIELEALTRIFETLNRKGVQLDAFDLMVAVLYPGERSSAGQNVEKRFKLRDEWNRAIKKNPVLAEFKTKGLEPLKLIALWRRSWDREWPPQRMNRRVMGVRQKDVLNTPASFVQANWPRAVAAYSAALHTIGRTGGFANGRSLPSPAMVLTLAYLLDAGYSPHDGEVGRWYWISIATQSYAQGANTQVTADLDRIVEIVTSERLRENAIKSAYGSLQDEIRRNRILRHGIRGLAHLNGALDPVSGEALSDRLIDLPITSVRAAVTQVPPTTPVCDMVTLNASSIAVLRRWGRASEDAYPLDREALESQGFVPDYLFPDDPEVVAAHRARRSGRVIDWLGGRLA